MHYQNSQTFRWLLYLIRFVILEADHLTSDGVDWSSPILIRVTAWPYGLTALTTLTCRWAYPWLAVYTSFFLHSSKFTTHSRPPALSICFYHGLPFFCVSYVPYRLLKHCQKTHVMDLLMCIRILKIRIRDLGSRRLWQSVMMPVSCRMLYSGSHMTILWYHAIQRRWHSWWMVVHLVQNSVFQLARQHGYGCTTICMIII